MAHFTLKKLSEASLSNSWFIVPSSMVKTTSILPDREFPVAWISSRCLASKCKSFNNTYVTYSKKHLRLCVPLYMFCPKNISEKSFTLFSVLYNTAYPPPLDSRLEPGQLPGGYILYGMLAGQTGPHPSPRSLVASKGHTWGHTDPRIPTPEDTALVWRWTTRGGGAYTASLHY